MDMEYSYLQVARMLNLSKNTIRARMAKAPEGSQIQKDGKWFITPNGYQWMVQEYGEPKEPQEAPQAPESDKAEDTQASIDPTLQMIMDSYEARLKDKDAEIARLTANYESRLSDKDAQIAQNQANYDKTLALLEDKQKDSAIDRAESAIPEGYKKTIFGLLKKI